MKKHPTLIALLSAVALALVLKACHRPVPGPVRQPAADADLLERRPPRRAAPPPGSPSDRQVRGTALVVLMLVAATIVAGVTWRSLAAPIAEQAAEAPATGVRVAATTLQNVQITIEPGWRAEEVALALHDEGAADPERFLALVREPALMTGIDESLRRLPSLEGYLTPGTYDLVATETEDVLLREMTQRSRRAFTTAMRARARELDLTEHEVITLASIVEREMVHVSEAPVIAGVFHARLDAGIALQSDPTVQYAVDSELGPVSTGYWRRAIRGDHLRSEYPYNTYLRGGVPPGPIASPSTAAIRGVLYPAAFGYRFFVAQGNGAHAFSQTYDQHLERVAEYRAGPATATVPSTKLQQLIERVFAPVSGRVGVMVKNLATGETAALNPDEFFTTASLYKLAVLLAAFERRHTGQLSFDEQLELPAATLQQDPPALRERLGERPTVAKAIEEMIITSSNRAALALLGRLGRSEIDSVLRRYGISDTSLVSQPLVTTPQDVARLLELVASERAVSADASREMAEILERQEIDDRLPKYLAAGVSLAHKTGDLVGLRHDVGVLETADGPVVIVAMTEDVSDEDAATEAIAQLGRTVHAYFGEYVPARETASQAPGRACPSTLSLSPALVALSGRSIVIDPGHGGVDPGARYEFPDGRVVEEKDVTLAVASRLRDLLVEQGASVQLTRCADISLGQSERAVIANAFAADATVSVHVNSAEDSGVDGTAVFYASDEGEVLAKYLLGSVTQPALWDVLSRETPLPNSGTKRELFDVLAFGRPVTALTESLFLTNPVEAELLHASLQTGAGRIDEIANGHLAGLLAYFGAARVPPSPESDSPGEFVLLRELIYARASGVDDSVALTFDDCNEPAAWARILAVLSAEGVTATFFCTTTSLLAEPELTRRTWQDGHTFGSHGYEHDRHAGHSLSELRQLFERELDEWRELKRFADIQQLPYFRPPFGAYDELTLVEAERAGFSRVVLWDVDSEDWRDDSSEALVRRASDGARGGSIVLLHVLEQTAEALPDIVAALRARGLRSVELEQLFRAGEGG